MKTNLNKNLKIEIESSNFKDLNKRFMLQPKTIKAFETETGCEVIVYGDSGLEALTNHITDAVHETLVKESIEQAFEDKGAHPEWAGVRLIPRLDLTDLNGPWKKKIAEDVMQYLLDASNTNLPFALDAYMTFGSSIVKDMIKSFSSELEELTFFGVIERSLSAIKEDLPDHEVPNAPSIELVGDVENMSFRSEEKELVHTSDLEGGFTNLYAEEVYFADSDRHKEALFYTYTLLMMSRWGIDNWLVPESIYENLEMYRKRLDIAVEIEKSVEPVVAL